MTTITTTLPPLTCLPQSEAEAEVATGVVTRILLTTTSMKTTMTTTAMTITTTVVVTRTRTMAMMTFRPQHEGGVAAGALVVELLPPEDVATAGHPEAGATSPSVAGQDQAVADGA